MFKQAIFRFKEIADNTRKRLRNEPPYYNGQHTPTLSKGEVESIAQFIEQIPYNATEHISVFKNEDWETLSFFLKTDPCYPDNKDIRRFIYAIVQAAPINWKFKFKYWLFKNFLYRLCLKVSFLKKFSKVPEEPSNFQGMFLTSNLYNPWVKMNRKWKWADKTTEEMVLNEIKERRSENANKTLGAYPDDSQLVKSNKEVEKLILTNDPPEIETEILDSDYLDHGVKVKKGKTWKFLSEETEELAMKGFESSKRGNN
jgi:hypothetical protein